MRIVLELFFLFLDDALPQPSTTGALILRGRVDRVDRLPSGEYELIDYKTGRPKTAEQLTEDVQLSLYAIGAREAWSLEASRGAYYYLLDDQKVAALAYKRREHIINLFIWPQTDAADQALQKSTRQGYHLVHWARGGFAFWAISDLNAAELEEFAELSMR